MRNNIQIIIYTRWVASMIINEVRRNCLHEKVHHLLHLTIQNQHEHRCCCFSKENIIDLIVQLTHTCLPTFIQLANLADILLPANSGWITTVLNNENFKDAQLIPSLFLLQCCSGYYYISIDELRAAFCSLMNSICALPYSKLHNILLDTMHHLHHHVAKSKIECRLLLT